MNYDEITKITAERIRDYMTEAVNTDSKAVAEMFHNAAWGVRAYSALFDHGLASKFDQRFASIRSTGNLTFSTAF